MIWVCLASENVSILASLEMSFLRVFGVFTPIILGTVSEILRGVKMELEDGAYPVCLLLITKCLSLLKLVQ